MTDQVTNDARGVALSEMGLVLHNAAIVGDSDTLDPVNGAVVIQGGRIVDVVRGGSLPQGMPTIDCGGRLLLPGLIDAHVHVTAVDTAYHTQHERKPDSLILIEAIARLQRMLDRGFTTVRDAGGADLGLKRAVEEGLVAGPRLLISGNPICQTGGHWDTRSRHSNRLPDIEPRFGPHAIIADGIDEVRRATRDQLRRGADVIKVFASGGVTGISDDLDDLQFTLAELQCIVEAASARGKPVMAHALTSESVIRSVMAGVHSIEHGSFMDERAAQEMAAHGTFLVPTLAYLHSAVDTSESNVSTTTQERSAVVLRKSKDAIKMAINLGVAVGLGSDLVGDTLDGMGAQFGYLADLIGPSQALTSLTSTNAAVCKVQDQLGSIESGKVADMILIDGDVMSDPALLESADNIVLVVKNGCVAKNLM